LGFAYLILGAIAVAGTYVVTITGQAVVTTPLQLIWTVSARLISSSRTPVIQSADLVTETPVATSYSLATVTVRSTLLP